MTKLYAYCAYQDRCRLEIEEKLRDLEVEEEEWESWLAHLQVERFWDEQRYAISFVRGKFYHKYWGPLKIRQELKRKKLSESLISSTISKQISAEELEEVLQKLIAKKWREYREKNRNKLIRFLLQKGYRWDEFRDLLPTETPS